MKLKIIRMTDEGQGFLHYLSERIADDEILDKNPKVELEELAQLCDLNAEDRNNHYYIGAHRILAILLFKKLGRKKATEIMLEIAEYGGLDAMNRLFADEIKDSLNAYKELGIEPPWREWSLPNA
jgi:hypothetical protein